MCNLKCLNNCTFGKVIVTGTKNKHRPHDTLSVLAVSVTINKSFFDLSVLFFNLSLCLCSLSPSVLVFLYFS